MKQVRVYSGYIDAINNDPLGRMKIKDPLYEDPYGITPPTSKLQASTR